MLQQTRSTKTKYLEEQKLKHTSNDVFASNFQNNLESTEHMYGNLEDGKLISLYRTVRARV